MSAAFVPAPSSADVDALCINTLRFLSVDAVQKANSGHPGLPLGAAPMAYVLWMRFLFEMRKAKLQELRTDIEKQHR